LPTRSRSAIAQARDNRSNADQALRLAGHAKADPLKRFEPMASACFIFFSRGIDVMLQIGVFGKLKLQNYARAGNRPGLFLFL
jgi:hypothetical protein